jgi:hypothetical protein
MFPFWNIRDWRRLAKHMRELELNGTPGRIRTCDLLLRSCNEDG